MDWTAYGLGPKATEQQLKEAIQKEAITPPENKNFSMEVKDLTKHAEASSPPELAKATSAIDKFADLPVNYEYLSKKWTIDLPKGTKPAFAYALAETIGRLLGEKEGDKHRIKVTEKGAHYQIRFQLENRAIGKEYIVGFINELIKGCEGLGIRDEAALARFLRECPLLSSALGNCRLYFQGNAPAIRSSLTDKEVAACVIEAEKQKVFSFIVLFAPCLQARQVDYHHTVFDLRNDAQMHFFAMESAIDRKKFGAAQTHLDAAKEILIDLAKIAKSDEDVQNTLLQFVYCNWKSLPEITEIVHPHLSDEGKKAVESLVATINFKDDYKSLLKEIDEAGLTTKIKGGFFAREDGKALQLEHLKLAMRLAALWAIHEDDHLAHALGIMKYVFDKAESDLKEPIAELMESIKSSPLPQVRARYKQIDAVVARFKQKTLLVEEASELKQKFGYGIQKDNEAGNYRLEPRDDAKTMKVREFQALQTLVMFAAKAGEVALIIESIRLAQSARLGFSDQSNQEVARDLYRFAMGWLRDFAPEAAALKQAFGKEFRSRVASDISEMVKKNFWEAKYLFNEFEDDTLMDELIQLIPADQRKGLAEKPTIDDVLARLVNRRAG